VRAFAERILLSDSLEEKLTHAPISLTLDPPQRGSYRTPGLPGRPSHLKPQKYQTKTAFPSAPQLEHEEHRAILLHFFANHELLATELMALALLKFPDAPDSFRRGVFHTLKEEQNHTRWYIQRMKECGINFGDLPVTPMIWDHIANMESPLDYVSRLSLTFEQANLDYAKHYSKIMADVGDSKSSKILAKIYHDEIAHVGHGIKWLRRWKEQSQSDWEAWHQRLHFPVSPIRAKGMAPFNEEGRRKAGLDAEFINSLKRYQSSRGRSRDIWYFNPDAEAEAGHPSWTCPKRFDDLAADLESAFALTGPTQDDLCLMRRQPSDAHRDYLAQFDLTFPELAPFEKREEIQICRKFRHLHPWAHPSPLLSKEITLKIRDLLPDELRPLPAEICTNIEEFASKHPYEKWVSKELYGAAGRGIHQFTKSSAPANCKHPLLVEPWVEKLSSTSLAKSTHGLPKDLSRAMGENVRPSVQNYLLPALEEFFSQTDYYGPICLDSFYFKTAEGFQWQPVVEVNARWTMGRIAHQLRQHLAPRHAVKLTTYSPEEARAFMNDSDTVVIADPAAAISKVPVAHILHSL